MTGRARLQPLLDLVAELAVAGGLTWDMLAAGQSGPVFVAREPRDLTRAVMFSAQFGNLVGYEWAQQSPDANALYAGGKGEGQPRPFVEAVDVGSVGVWGRIEGVVDATDKEFPVELGQAAQTALVDLASSTEVKVTPTEGVVGARYLLDYLLGDVVACIVDGIVVHEEVRQVKGTFDADGVHIVPSVGADVLDTVAVLLTQRRLAQRVRNLERT